jgi:hypothetical protein
MRKSLQRITLSRETLRHLEGGPLQRAVGGAIGPESYVFSNCPTCDSQITNCAKTNCVTICTK